MTPLKDQFQIQTDIGQPVTAGDTTVTPQSRTFIIRLPTSGFVWKQPTAVLVERGGQAQWLPVIDITRILQLWLLGLSLVLFIVSLIKFSQRKEPAHDRRQK